MKEQTILRLGTTANERETSRSSYESFFEDGTQEEARRNQKKLTKDVLT